MKENMIGLVNARSVMNKTDQLRKLIIDNHLTCLAITETWQRCNDTDQKMTTKINLPHYTFCGAPRPSDKGSRGGGVGLVMQDSSELKENRGESYESFEVMTLSSKVITIVIVYRPPRKASRKKFLTELRKLLENLSTSASDHLCIMGDFNLHVDDEKNRVTAQLMEILDELRLSQQIMEPTHREGHTLDLVITREDDTSFSDFKVTKEGCISDHFLITFKFSSSMAALNNCMPRFGPPAQPPPPSRDVPDTDSSPAAQHAASYADSVAAVDESAASMDFTLFGSHQCAMTTPWSATSTTTACRNL